ncbi:MAG: hypothetical protein WCT16_03080 [Candidatus Buchananbacteria bacterium]
MPSKISIICEGRKLQTIRDIHIEDRLIPSGTIFYACVHNDNIDFGVVRPIIISGFGHCLTSGIRVSTVDPTDPKTQWDWEKSSIFLPLDCLQLLQK